MTSGRRVFQQHTERTEGSDTTPASHTRKGPVCAERRSRNFGRSKKRSRSPAGPRRLGTATRMSASLFRGSLRSSGAPSSQDPKAAKFAVLPPGHAGFPKRVKQSEGSDTTPVRNTPVSACEPLCAIFLREPSVYPLSPVKANVGHLWEKLKNAMKDGLR